MAKAFFTHEANFISVKTSPVNKSPKLLSIEVQAVQAGMNFFPSLLK